MYQNINKIYHAAIYVRLSKEDGDVSSSAKLESNSISNQKALILDFLKDKKDIEVVSVRVDDGYSGSNFERPAFQAMLEDIRRGIVDCVKDCIRDMGYTKVSFAAKADISRPTLDKLLNGNIDSKSSFDRHLQKILKLLNITIEDLMLYHSAPSKLSEATLYSQNAPMNHEMNDTAKKQYNLLLDIIDLCAIYFKGKDIDDVWDAI